LLWLVSNSKLPKSLRLRKFVLLTSHNNQLGDHACHDVPWRGTDNLIFTRLSRRCKSIGLRSPRFQLQFPKHVGDVSVIPGISGSRAQLHHNKVMFDGAIIIGSYRDLLPGGDKKRIGRELKIGQGYLDRVRGSRSATCHQSKTNQINKMKIIFLIKFSFLFERLSIVRLD